MSYKRAPIRDWQQDLHADNRPDCPSCQGVGQDCEVCTSTGYLSSRRTTDAKISEKKVYARIESMNSTYSDRSYWGKSACADESAFNDVWLGSAGQEYRRLMAYLWAMPAEQQELGPMKPFAELFAFEKKVRKRKAINAIEPKTHTWFEDAEPLVNPDAQFDVDAKAFSKALKEASNVINRSSTIPILLDVRITAERDCLKITATDLDKWEFRQVEAQVRQPGVLCLPAMRLIAIARLCGKSTMTFNWFSEKGVAIIRCENAEFKLIGLPVDNFPCEPAELAERNAKTDPKPTPEPIRPAESILAREKRETVYFIPFGKNFKAVHITA